MLEEIIILEKEQYVVNTMDILMTGTMECGAMRMLELVKTQANIQKTQRGCKVTERVKSHVSQVIFLTNYIFMWISFNTRWFILSYCFLIIAFKVINVTSIGTEIMSTNYPKPYLFNEHIAYRIQIPEDQKFYLHFLAFELQNPEQLDKWRDWKIDCK